MNLLLLDVGAGLAVELELKLCGFGNESREIGESFGLTVSIQLDVRCVAICVSPVADDWLLANWFDMEFDRVEFGAGMSVSGTR